MTALIFLYLRLTRSELVITRVLTPLSLACDPLWSLHRSPVLLRPPGNRVMRRYGLCGANTA
jgi:hypothetical protein